MVKSAKGASQQKYHLGSSPRCYEHVPSGDKISERTPELNFFESFLSDFSFFRFRFSNLDGTWYLINELLYCSSNTLSWIEYSGLCTLVLQQYLNTSWIVVEFRTIFEWFCVFEDSGLSVSCLVCGRFNPSLQARWSSPSRLLSSSPTTRTSLASTM